MIIKFRKPFIALIAAVFMFLFTTSPVTAAMVGSITSSRQTIQSVEFDKDVIKVQCALENKIVQEKLEAYGLTVNEIRTKLHSMSDKQIHMLAQVSDDILSGGDAIGTVIGILLIVLLVVLIMKLMNKTVVIK